jgi:glycosyltransferase involved in cell wall biosynthesis
MRDRGHGLRLLVLSNGSVYHTQRWADYFVDRGDWVHVASVEPHLPSRAETRRLPALAPIAALRYPLVLPWLKRLAARVEPDVVVGHFVPNYGFLAALLGRHPAVCVVWGSDVLINAARSRFHLWRARFTLERLDLVLVDAELAARKIADLGIRPRRMETLTFGVDVDRFRPPAGTRPDPPVVLSIRQLLPIYRVDLLVRAVPLILKRARAAFQVRIVGQGSERPRLAALADSLGVGDRITFVGGGLDESRLIEEIQRASIYVSTSASDTTSVSLLEAMACGVPPVVSDIAGNREWITNGENGILVSLDGPDALADGIVELLERPERGVRFAERNLRLVRSKANWARNMDRTRQLLLDLVRTSEGSTSRRTEWRESS